MKLKAIVAIAALPTLAGSPAFAQSLITVTGANSGSASSFLAGAQTGYNWQRGSFVYGLEADISGMNLDTRLNTVLPPIPGPSFAVGSTRADIDWYGTVRGRLGWSAGPVLCYGTGGLAYGDADLNSTLSTPFSTLNAQTSSLRTGWVAGGGAEYHWSPNVILRLEYQHVDLGSLSVANSGGTLGTTGILSQSANAQARFDVVTAGVSWLFPPAGSSGGTWEGLYVGGHVGGADGDETNANYSWVVAPPSDIRLKRDVALIGHLDNGLGLYRYRYLWSDTVYVGVMAQEVALLRPDAVVRDALDDYLRVDYGRLGLRLMTLPEWNARDQRDSL